MFRRPPSATLLHVARVASLFLSFLFAIIGLATNINAFVVSTTQKDDIRRIVPQRIDFVVDDRDVVGAGAAVTLFSAFIILASLVCLGLLLLDSLKPGVKHGWCGRWAERCTHPVQGAILGVLSVALFAALVALTDFVANHAAKVSASSRGVALPNSVIQTVARELGVTTTYRHLHYLVAAAVLPWFTFLFTASASMLSFVAGERKFRWRPWRLNAKAEAQGEKPAEEGAEAAEERGEQSAA